MPKLDLEPIKARAAAATPGPYMVDGGEDFGIYAPWNEDALKHGEFDQFVASTGDSDRSHADAVFLAYARTDIPALIARVEALEKEIAAIQRKANLDLLQDGPYRQGV